MTENTQSINTLQDLLDYNAGKFTSGEIQLKKSLSEWIKSAASLQLKAVLEKYYDFVEQHVQKMESLGILAGGIAHDFNNLLTSILGYADLALRELSPVHPAREYIEQVIKGSHSAADLVRQLLAYSGKGKFLMQSLNLAQLIEEMGHLLQVSISKKCVLNYRFEKDLPNIDADCSQIRQVIMNLIINASDAIGERSGVITITTGMMYCDRSYLNGTSADPSKPEGNYVYFEVSDTGCGMNDEVAARIFDPFYTTKTMGRGLGLAAVLGIVRSHGGFIKLYSEVDRGTTFKVLFPASRELQTEAQLSQGNPERAWSTQGTVLLIDDEETVRAVARVMLQRMGFSVITAVDGADGLNKYAAHQQDISLVVMDMTMPHLNGEQTFRELRKINPEVIVILTSGYSEHSAMSQFSGKGLAGFIQKPFRFDDLMTLVRQIHSST